MTRARAQRPSLLCAGVLLASACSRAPEMAAPDGMQRLLPALGTAEPLTLDGDTRPATSMAPGETRVCRVAVGRGSLLLFAIGIVDGAAGEGSVRLRVRAGGRVLLEETVPLSRRRWLNRSVRFDEAGEIPLEFSAAAQGGSSQPTAPRIALASPRVSPPRKTRPRILVWISQDTLRADHLGAYGYDRQTSPNFDRLGRGWTVFDRAVSPASWTLPSLASQMTSRYPSFHGATHRSKTADTRHPTIFETLAAEGFTVLGVTGNPFVSPKYTLNRGFDTLIYTGLRADVVSRLVLHQLGQWGGGDLAVFVHYMDPHDPYNPPEPFRAMFGGPYQGEVNGYNHRSSAKTKEDIDHVRALYDGEVAFVDREIAGLLEAFGQKGILDQAVIVYTADHGEELMDRGGWGHAHTLYEELLHVPFALRVPGAPARRIAAPVSLVDLAPTLLDALGVRAPLSYQGRSLMPIVRGGALPAVPLFAETARSGKWHQIAVRDGRFKYVARFAEAEGEPRRAGEELFDLETDPLERKREEPSPEAERLRREVDAFVARSRAELPESKPAVLDAAEEEELKALGYVN